MKIKKNEQSFLLTDISSKYIKHRGVIKQNNDLYEVFLDNLLVGENIFVFTSDELGKVNSEEDLEYDDRVIEYKEYKYYIYMTKNFNLVIYKNYNIIGNYSFSVEKLKYQKKHLELIYKTENINKWEKLKKVLLIERTTQKQVEVNVDELEDKVLIDTNLFEKTGIYDIFIKVLIDDKNFYLKKIDRYRFLKRIFLKDHFFENGILISPYTTYKGSNLSFKIDLIEKKNYLELNKSSKKKDIWLIGEQKTKGQDNGYYFYKYLKENHPNVKAYFVINSDSQDYNKIKNIDKNTIIEFGCEEHFKIMKRVKYLISTHHDHYLFPVQAKSIIKKNKAKRIFLQHGVMGTKYMADFYGNHSFKTDLFIVTSEREKDMIVRDFEYPKSMVKVTGLARFDNLFKNDVSLDNDILIIPTWRDWLANNHDFENTEYFKRYVSLLDKLSHIERIHFVLHINMKTYKSYFEKLGIKVSIADEVDVQKLLKSSKLMITDYSSVSFDFSFLDKPVLYYQFDQKLFFGNLGSHYDIAKELPGTIKTTEKEILMEVEKIQKNNYQIDKEVQMKINNLIKYKDEKASERIYNAIVSKDYKNFKFKNIRKIFRLFGMRYRKSRFYIPSMNKIYNLLKYLPKKKIIIFESNNGKSFVDSPKDIYNAWDTENSDYKFYIVIKKSIKNNYRNKNTIVRLSPKYFYYLARAKVWVNNQNFPFYIKNNKTIYLQTWHGTPIKKMLNDLDNIVGRDLGYQNRVQTAIKQWTHLLVSSDYEKECFKTAFKHEAREIEVGKPRNDIFFKNFNLNEMKNKYGLDKNKKTILLAPTFRDDGNKIKNLYSQNLNIDYKNMYENLSKEYEFIIKLHPLAFNENEILQEYSNFFKIANDTDDINNLLLISDILITDYSSIMFDYLLLKGKTILYVHDIERYEYKNRGFYMNFEKDAPGIVVKNQKELINEIKKEELNYDKEKFKRKFMTSDNGNSSENVVKVLTGLIKANNKGK